MVPAGLAKRRRLAAVQIGGYQGQFGFEFAEIVGAAFAAEQARQLGVDSLVGKHTCGQAWAQLL